MPVGPHGTFEVGARVDAPGFTTYPRMTVAAHEWRDMDRPGSRLRGWWCLCDPDPEPGMVTGRLSLHPSWLVEVPAIDQLASLAS